MAVALQILASGFAAGAVYGLVAVGHSLVFRLTGVVHFAFGELIALGVFMTLLVAAGSGPVSQTSVGGGRFLARARRRPGRHGGRERRLVLPRDRAVPRARLGDRLGRGLARRRVRGPDAARRLLRPAGVRLPRPAAVPDRRRRFWHVGGATIQARSLFVAAAALVLAAAAGGCSAHAIRPRARGDRAGLRRRVLVGLPVTRLVGVAFALAGVWAGLAAVLAAPSAAFDPERPRATASTACSPRRRRGSTRAGRSLAGLALGLMQATVTSAHWGAAGRRTAT